MLQRVILDLLSFAALAGFSVALFLLVSGVRS